MCRQLNGQPVGKGSLTRGGRTGDHNELLVSGLHDLLCNSGNSRLLDGLLHKKDLLYPLGNDLVIQFTYCGDFQLSAPTLQNPSAPGRSSPGAGIPEAHPEP